jgi:hypothetical protein
MTPRKTMWQESPEATHEPRGHSRHLATSPGRQSLTTELHRESGVTTIDTWTGIGWIDMAIVAASSPRETRLA